MSLRDGARLVVSLIAGLSACVLATITAGALPAPAVTHSGSNIRIVAYHRATAPRLAAMVFAVGREDQRRLDESRPEAASTSTVRITTTSLAKATVGVTYSATLEASGGTTPFRWRVVGAAGPPPGITFSPGGRLRGDPTASGDYQFTVQVTDSSAPSRHTAKASVTLPVYSPAPRTDHPANWSGYEFEGGPFTAVIGNFHVPSLRPSPGDTFTSEWVGIDGATNSSLIQAGVTEEYDAATKSVLTGAWWEILPAASTPIPMTVNPGDECMVTIYQVSGATWSITLSDVTTGQSFSTEKSYSGPGATEEWIVEAPMNERTGKEDTLGHFSPAVTFSNMRATGTVTAWAKDIMVQNGVRVSVPSTLGTYGFTVAYRSATPLSS